MDVCGGDENAVYEMGATVEPSSVAYNCVFERAGGFRPGATVVVYGQGPIGLTAAAECKAAGAAIEKARARLKEVSLETLIRAALTILA